MNATRWQFFFVTWTCDDGKNTPSRYNRPSHTVHGIAPRWPTVTPCWTEKQKAWDFSEAQILCQFLRAPKTTTIWWVAQAVEKTAFGVAALQKTTFQQTVSMIWGYPGGVFSSNIHKWNSLYFSLPRPSPKKTHTLVSGQNGNKYVSPST